MACRKPLAMGLDGRGEQLESEEKTVEAIAEACVHAADKLIGALDPRACALIAQVRNTVKRQDLLHAQRGPSGHG